MHVTVLSLAAPGGCCGERVPVLACRDALRSAGARVATVTAESDDQIDDAFADLGAEHRLVVAATTDGEIRALLRRMVRRHAPPASKRPADLPADRTIYDLPAIGILPLDAGSPPDLAARLGLPRSPEEVAAAVTGEQTRRVDLLRTDSGSVTLHGSLVGGADQHGQATAWYGRVEVDDAVLSDGSEPLIACAIANAPGYATIDDLPLVGAADPGDGAIDVGVAVPALRRGVLRRTLRVEVRRARGRAVSVTPRDEVPYLDDGVAGSLGRKRSWWIEPAAWGVYLR